MPRQTVYKLWNVSTLLWLALVLALVGSLRHVAWGFSTLEQGDLIAGYIQAVAVDVGMLALSIGIQNRKRQARATRSLWAGVILFSVVSTYANLLHGLYFQTDLGLTSLQWLVAIRPVILSGVLPCLVVYLAEVAGDDVNHAAKLAEREAKREARQVSSPTMAQLSTLAPDVSDTEELTSEIDTFPMPVEQARQAKVDVDTQTKQERVGKLLTLCTSTPDIGVTELAEQLGVSRTAVYTYVKELVKAGRLHKNGNGWEVVNVDVMPVATVDAGPAVN